LNRYLRSLVRRLHRHLRVTSADEIARRYLVMNGFDGALAALGIIMAFYISGHMEPSLVLSAGFGAALAMGVSGAWGAFITERAERARKLRELEEALYTELDDSIIARASLVSVIVVALVDALAPIIAATVALSPFLFVQWKMLPRDSAFYASVGLDLGFLFILGVVLGRSARASTLIYGGLMVLIGLFTASLFLILGLSFSL
jgi:predicted membrane protein (TIGR00267 family)